MADIFSAEMAGPRGPGLTDADLTTLDGKVANAAASAENAATAKSGAQEAQEAAELAAEKVKIVPSGRSAFVVRAGADVLAEITGARIEHPQIDTLEESVAETASRLGDFANFSNVASGRSAVALTDDDGNIVAEISATRIEHPQIAALEAASQSGGAAGALVSRVYVARNYERRDAKWDSIQLLASVSVIAISGQSNGHGSYATPIISTTPSAWAKMFVGGVRPFDDSPDPVTTRASLVPLVEGQSSYTDDTGGETEASGFAAMFAQLMLDEEGIDLADGDQTMLFVNHSAPGQPIANLETGTQAFTDMTDSMNAGAVRAAALHKSYAVAAESLDIGETNQNGGTSQADYVAANIAYRSHIEAVAKAASGLDRPFPFILNQMNTLRVDDPGPYPIDGSVRPNIALAQLQLAREQDYFCLALPSYCLSHAPDGIHCSAFGQRIKGAYKGRAVKRWLVDGIKPRPVAPLYAKRQGKFVHVKLDVQSRTQIEIDLAAFPDVPNAGVQVVNSGGAPLTVVGVAVAWGDTIVVELSAAVPAGAWFRYAWAGVHAGFLGQVSQLQGCIRDTEGDRLVFDPAGTNRPMHNWMVACEIAIS